MTRGIGAATRSVAADAVKIFPVGKLFRRAGGSRNGLDEAAMAARRGDPTIGRPRNIPQRHAWGRAQRARDELHDRLVRNNQRKKELIRKKEDRSAPKEERQAANRELQEFTTGEGKAETVTGATDPETGITRTGYNHKPKPDADGWSCAEKMALDEINDARAAMTPPRRALEPHEVDFAEAIELGKNVGDRTQKPVDPVYCQERLNPEQFPNGTQYDSGGRWETFVSRLEYSS